MSFRILVILALLPSCLFSGPVPADKPTHYPDWWFERDVIPRLPASVGKTDPRWLSDYPAADDFAVVNIGQLKYIALKAAAEMDARLPAPGAGLDLHALITAWATPPQVGVIRDDYATANQGQLKYIAKLFYDRLANFGYSGPPLSGGSAYPWTQGPGQVSDDDAYALVNLGQLKYVFSFIPASLAIDMDPFLADSDFDGICNGWEIEHGLDPFNAADASIVTGGLTNLEIYQQSLGSGGDPLQANVLGLTVYSP